MGRRLPEKLIGVTRTFDIGEVGVVHIREREAPERKLNEGDAQGPDVGFDRVFGALDALRLGIGNGINFVRPILSGKTDD